MNGNLFPSVGGGRTVGDLILGATEGSLSVLASAAWREDIPAVHSPGRAHLHPRAGKSGLGPRVAHGSEPRL